MVHGGQAPEHRSVGGLIPPLGTINPVFSIHYRTPARDLQWVCIGDTLWDTSSPGAIAAVSGALSDQAGAPR
jgi:hypothetical protein